MNSLPDDQRSRARDLVPADHSLDHALAALATLAERSSLPFDVAEAARQAREFSATDHALTFAEDWTTSIERLARRLQLRAVLVPVRIADLRAALERHGTLLTHANGTFYVLTTARWYGMNVVAVPGPAEERPMSARALAGRLGTKVTAEAHFLALDPVLPMRALATPSARHEGAGHHGGVDPHAGGHGGHGGHGDHGGHDGHGEGHLTPQRRLWNLLRDEHVDVWAVVVYAVAAGLLSLAVPIAVQSLVSFAAFGAMSQPVVVLTLLVFVALAFDGVLRLLQTTVVEWMQQRTFVRTALDMATRLASAKPSALSGGYAPELANRFFDVVTVQKAAATLLLDGLGLLLKTFIGMVLLAFYHPWLLAFDAVLVTFIAFVIFGLGRSAVSTAISESKAKYAVASWLEDIARHQTVFRARQARGFALERVDELTARYVSERRRHYRVLFRQIAGTMAIQALASAALLGVGGLLVIQRQLTLGQLVAAELIVTSVVSGVAKFGKHLESYYDLLAAMDKLGHVVDLPLEHEGHEHLPPSEHGIEVTLRAVTLRQGARHLVDHIDLRLAPGARVSIEGPHGSGKSTIIDLLFGLHRPDSGVILVDGVDVRELELAHYRSEVALLRGIEIFEGSIVDNVRMGRNHLSASDVRRALSAAGLMDDVLALPGGMSTRLSQSGAPLSSGQALKLMVARALVDRPRLVLVDETIDDLDRSSRAAVIGALFDPEACWTTVIATHSPEVAACCSTRYRLEAGVLERVSGTHLAAPGDGSGLLRRPKGLSGEPSNHRDSASDEEIPS